MCGQCQPMLTAQESVCCQEVDKVRDLLVGDPARSIQPWFASRFTDFAKACLCRVILSIASHCHRHHYGTDDMPANENR